MIYVITWTSFRVEGVGFTKYLVWFFCMVTSVGVIQQIYHMAKKEATEFPNGYENPQILSLLDFAKPRICCISDFFSRPYLTQSNTLVCMKDTEPEKLAALIKRIGNHMKSE